MKITCELFSRETHKLITSTEIESDYFGASRDNPFPASEIWTCSFCPTGATVTYMVAEAFGNCGTWEPREQVAA